LEDQVTHKKDDYRLLVRMRVLLIKYTFHKTAYFSLAVE